MDATLAKKLQLQPDQKLIIVNAPKGYVQQLTQVLAENPVTTRTVGQAEAVLIFVNSLADAKRLAPKGIKLVKPDGLLWIGYPKGSSKVKADINRDTLWQAIEPTGWQGVRLIALDATWSVMRFRPAAKVGQ